MAKTFSALLSFAPYFFYFFLISAQYAMFLYGFLQKWRKKPQCSFSCCLALLLTLNDVQGEISGFAETNVLQNQLQTGQIEMPTILASVKDSGAIEVSLEEDEQADEKKVEIQAKNYQGIEPSGTRCHQETQTDLLDPSLAGLVVKKSMEENDRNSCGSNIQIIMHFEFKNI